MRGQTLLTVGYYICEKNDIIKCIDCRHGN